MAGFAVLVVAACSGGTDKPNYDPTCRFVGSCLMGSVPTDGYCFERVMTTCSDHDVAEDFMAFCAKSPGTYSKEHCPDTQFGCCAPPSGSQGVLSCSVEGESQCFYGNFQGKTSEESCLAGGGIFHKPGEPPTPPTCL